MLWRYQAVSWDQIHADARALARQLIGKGPFRGVVAVSRGGMIPAAIVARELEIRLVESVCVVTYGQGDADWTVIAEPVVIKSPAAAGDGEGFLIIDDLVDTGTTARVVRGLLPRAYFACLYAKPAGKPAVDLFITEVSQDTWLMFPWDTEPRFAVPLAKRDKA